MSSSIDYHFEAIGTQWNIQISESLSHEGHSGLRKKITERIEQFDKIYSRFREDSLVTYASQKAGHHAMPVDGYKLFQLYNQLYKITEGKVTPLIGSTMEASGYDAQYSFKPKALHQPLKWEEALSYDKQSFTLVKPTLLDFGAAGKGYLVDIIGELIEHSGIREYLINAGGDIRHRSTSAKAIEVGLENPLNATEAIGVVQLKNQSLCASSGSKRQWGSFNHIINPLSLQSPHNILATWVIADDTLTADGLATALFFTEAAQLQKQFTFSYAVLSRNMELRQSTNFPAEVFSRQAL